MSPAPWYCVPGAWVWWPEAGRVGQVLDTQDVYGTSSATVHTVGDAKVHTVAAHDLLRADQRTWSDSEVLWRLAAGRALSLASSGQPLLSHAEGFALLPHQDAILRRAIGMDPVRLAICCEVGLGKTTTAGAIVAEMLARNEVHRVLVVAPKGVQLQWVAEMRDKFNLDFTRIGPEGVPMSTADVWKTVDLALTSTDAVKPLRRRAGWTPAQVQAQNESRFNGMVNAGWDLVIIDEAHHAAGSSDDVARHRLARALSDSTRHILLLTATPHSGKSEAFRRFLSLVDHDFAQGRPISASTVAEVVARTSKRTAVDAAGLPLFRPRTTRMEIVPWADKHLHRQLYDDVTEWVREGYAAATSSGNRASGFLLLLFQRLVSSSTPALISTLERRRAALLATVSSVGSDDDLVDLLALDDEDHTEMIERVPGLPGELLALDSIIRASHEARSSGPDPKVVHFLTLLRALQRAEHDPHVKILVFTQFRATQSMLMDLLVQQGIKVTGIDGSMGLEDRAQSQRRFADDAQVLVSTDAGGEGVNLQFAHVAVSWDLPWSPSVLEQRIGRVDRIGQAHDVLAINMALEESVDQRVIEVLEEKLQRILEEMGVDKRGDVLATADGLMDGLYVAAIMAPDGLAEAGQKFLAEALEALQETAAERDMLDRVSVVAPQPTASAMPQLLKTLETVVGNPPWTLLGEHPWMVPGETAPVVQGDDGGPGWLVLARVSVIGEHDYLPNYFAIAMADDGRIDPAGGEREWGRLALNFPGVLGTAPIDADTYARAERSLLDFAYRPLQQLTGGAPAHALALRPALIVRLEPSPSQP